MSGWKEKHLSYSGKYTLIKVVTQVIPTYAMSIFKFPDNLCDDIDRLACNYWWGAKNNEMRTCWTSWNKLCLNRNKGGISFRKMNIFNDAFVAK